MQIQELVADHNEKYLGLPTDMLDHERGSEAVPFVVLGGFNHASLFRVRNLSGFTNSPSASMVAFARRIKAAPYFWGGVYSHGAAMRVVAAVPGTQRIVLTSVAPTCWEVVSGESVQRFFIDGDYRIHRRP